MSKTIETEAMTQMQVDGSRRRVEVVEPTTTPFEPHAEWPNASSQCGLERTLFECFRVHVLLYFLLTPSDVNLHTRAKMRVLTPSVVPIVSIDDADSCNGAVATTWTEELVITSARHSIRRGLHDAESLKAYSKTTPVVR